LKLKENKLVKPPSTFTVLPIWSLQPATLTLAQTQMETLRGKANIDKLNILDGFMNVNFINKIRRTHQNEEQKTMGWKVINVLTNGVSVTVLFGAIKKFACLATNVRVLDKKGYNLGNSKINICEEIRGIHSCSCGNNCLKKINNVDDICLTLVDPGRSDVFSVCHIDLNKSNDPRDIKEHGKFWNMSSKDYRHKTGNGNFNATYQEHSRRCGQYLKFIQEISKEKRYTCNIDSLTGYIHVVSKYIVPLKKEKCRRDRLKSKWDVRMQTDSTLARTANKMFEKCDQEREYKEKAELYEQLNDEEKIKFEERIPWKKLNDEERRELRKKWKDNIENRKKKTHVVFFGNGLFPTGGSGYPCVPRKRFLRYLAASGVVVILDEFKTSKCCPGCHNELEDTDEKRVRRCKSDQSVSCLLSSENGAPFKDDRDVIATINMAICAHGLLVSGKRPKYLSREKYKRGTVEFEQTKLNNEYSCL